MSVFREVDFVFLYFYFFHYLQFPQLGIVDVAHVWCIPLLRSPLCCLVAEMQLDITLESIASPEVKCGIWTILWYLFRVCISGSKKNKQ